MVFEIDPNRPDVPGIARILLAMGYFSLFGCIVAALFSFSAYGWVNDTYAMITAGGLLILAVVLVGQAKTLELLAVVSARVKSRFAIEHAVMPTQASAAPLGERKLPTAATIQKDRVISIPEEVARQQGVTRRAPAIE